MARKPHLKVSFDPTEIERLQKRAEQSGMKRPQDYIRYLVQHDDENMGVHVAFEERDTLELQLQQIADYLDCALKDGEKHGDGWRFNSTITAINNLENGKKQAEIDRDELKKHEENGWIQAANAEGEFLRIEKERDDWAAKANEAAAEAVKIAESIRENEKLADTWKGDVADALGVQAVTSVMIDAINDRKQDLETTKADLKNTNAAAIENMKAIASSLGVPDTVEHIVQRVGELNDSLKYCVNYGNAMSDICEVIGINSFEDDNLPVIINKVGELNQNLETAKSDRDNLANELTTLGDLWEIRYKKLANDPIVKIIWRRFRQSLSDFFRHKGNE